MKQGTTFTLEVNPKIPRKLMRLEELANNLWYSWDKPTRTLFARLHPGLWDAVAHNPKVFLRRVDEKRLLDAVGRPGVSRHLQPRSVGLSTPTTTSWCATIVTARLKEGDLVAYFCAEFGFHESFPIYSGGLGILAGDHCKAASDMCVPFVAVGLLYRQGYFSQTIDGDGNQIATYSDSDFAICRSAPALRDDGSEVHVTVELPGRQVSGKGLAGRRRPRALVPARYRPRGKCARRPRHRPPALWRRPQHAPDAGNHPRRRRRTRLAGARPEADGVAH